VFVRDLNSVGGTALDGQPLDRDEATTRFGGALLLGGRVAVRLNLDGIQVGDKIYKALSGQMIISREPIEVLALGESDKKLSNPHCLIRREGRDYFVRDLHSRNGVIVGDQELGSDEAIIPPGAVLKLGQTTFGRSGG
jgi:pSer/pThr/pTyr-binding forkhead associated (FHA) protein